MPDEPVWFNTTTHPIALDDGRTVGSGEFVPSDADTSGQVFKEAVEAGHFIKGGQVASETDVNYQKKRAFASWDEHSVPELKAALEERNLPSEGKKADLVDRLETYERQGEGE